MIAGQESFQVEPLSFKLYCLMWEDTFPKAAELKNILDMSICNT